MNIFSRREVGVGALYAVLSILFCLPLFSRPLGLGIADWDQHLFYYAEVLKSVVEYGQAPFWSPWYCSGNVMWQNPQVALLSPAYLLTAVMPLALAMKVNIVLHYWVGFIGMHLLLTRVIGLTFLPAIAYIASIFTLGGAVALHLSVGHSIFLPAFYLPWQIYFLCRAVQTGAVRYALAAAAMLALTIYNGGLHMVPMGALAIGAVAVCFAVARRNWRPLVLAFIVAICGALYAAPKLAPIVQFVTNERFHDARNPTDHPDRMTLDMLWRAYTDGAVEAGQAMSPVQRHGWWEYGNYMGTAGASGVAIAILWSLVSSAMRRRAFAVTMALTAAFFLVLSAGEFHPFAPALGLAGLPVFSSFRIPSRYTIAFAMFGALALGSAARAMIDRFVSTRTRRYLVAVACGLAIAQLVIVNQRRFAETFSQPSLDSSFAILKGSHAAPVNAEINPYAPNAPMLRAMMSGQSVDYCYEPLQLTRGADITHPYLWVEGSAAISKIDFTPNRVRFSVIGGFRPSKIFLNQNYSTGWSSTVGPVLVDPKDGGKMYTRLAAGQTGRFTFSFVPPGFQLGFALLIAGLVASALLWNRTLAAMPIADQTISSTVPESLIEYVERGTKMLVLASLALTAVVRPMMGDSTTLALLVTGTFAFTFIASVAWDSMVAVVLVTLFVVPAISWSSSLHDASILPTYLTAALLGAILPHGSWRRWSLPQAWRVPLVGWALAGATGWLIVAVREVDFHPELAGITNMPTSIIGLTARASIVSASDAAALLMLGIVWLDWGFNQFRHNPSRFRSRIIMPIIAGGCLAAIVALYQSLIDIRFMNPGWADFHRASGTTMDANGFGIAAVLCSCGCFALIDGRSRAWTRVALGGFFLTLTGVWTSGSRTALVAEAIAVAFAALSMVWPTASGDDPRRRRRRAQVMGGAAVTAVVLLWMLRDTGPVLRLRWIVPSASVDSIVDFAKQMMWVRFGYGTAASEMIRSNPWFGVGIGAFPLIVGDYPYSHLGGPLSPDNAQNWIRHNLAELGIIGSLGWIVWTMVIVRSAVAGSNRPRNREMTVVAGAIVGVLLVSQVGMPTGNPIVAIMFPTFVLWYFLDENISDTPSAPWHWITMAGLVIVFAAGTFRAGLTTLRPSMRARAAGWNYDYGLYRPERDALGEEFRWTKQDAVAVIRAPSRYIRVSVWVTRPDVADHPSLIRVWHDDSVVIEKVVNDHRPISAEFFIDRSPQWLLLRTYLDRTLRDEAPERGLAVSWTFLEMRTDTSVQAAK